MPYDYDPNLVRKKPEDEENTQISSGSGTPSGSPLQAAAGGSAPQQKKDTGSGFQSLDAYFNANKNNNTGQQIIGNVSGEIKGVKQAGQNAANQFKSEVDKLNPVASQSDIQKAVNAGKPTSLGGSGGAVADSSLGQNWLNQTYKGPKNISDSGLFTGIQNQANQAMDEAKDLSSAGGRETLLDKYFGKTGYTTGQKALDDAFITHDPNFGRNVFNLSSQSKQLAQQQGQLQGAASGYAQQKSNAIDAQKDALRKALGLDINNQVIQGSGAGALGQAYQAINDRLAQENQQRDQAYQALTDSTIRPDELALLGINGNEPIINNLDLTKYVKENAPLTTNQAMSSEEQAYLSNLAKLAGINDTFANNPVSNPTDAYTVDKQGFLKARQDVMQKVTNDLNSMKDPITGLTVTEMQNQLNKYAGGLAPVDPSKPSYTDYIKNRMDLMMKQIYQKNGVEYNSTYGGPSGPNVGGSIQRGMGGRI